MESILVLNADYTPINITDLKRAFNLIYKGKAEIIKHNIISPIVTELRNFKRPTIIRLLRYITIPFRKVKLNRNNIFSRLVSNSNGIAILYRSKASKET